MPQKTDFTPTHLDFVDALRGWAILLVMLVHSSVMVQGLPSIVQKLAEKGRYGVQLFFIMSAFTLFLSYESRRRRDPHPVRAFFVRRLFRIAPLFWFGMVFYIYFYGLNYSLFSPGGLGWKELLSTATFLHGFHPLTINRIVPGGWSIAAEMVFYLGVPLCYVFAKTMPRALGLFAASLFIAAACAHFKVLEIIYPWFALNKPLMLVNMAYYWLPTQMPVFALGFVLFHLIKARSQGEPGRQTEALGLFGLALAACFCGTWLLSEQVLYAILFCIGAYALSQVKVGFLVNRLTRYIGMVSFSAYITHFFVLDLVWRIVGSQPKLDIRNASFAKNIIPAQWLPAGIDPLLQYLLIYGLLVAGTVAVSTILYRLVEVPGQKLGKVIINRLGW